MKGIAGEDKKDRPGIERAPRESDFWYPLGRRRQPELLRVHDGFAWRSTADLRPSKNSRWADVAVRQLSYVDCRARADRRSHWAEAVRVLRLRPLGVHSDRQNRVCLWSECHCSGFALRAELMAGPAALA